MPDRMFTRRTALLAGLALGALPALAGCGSRSGPTEADGPPRLSVPASRTTIPLADVHDLPDVVAGLRHFGTAFYRANAAIGENFTASPLSIAVALGMLRAGSRGQTGSAIDAAFGFPRGTAVSGAVHPALNALTAHLVTAQPVGTAPSPTLTDGRPRDPIVAIANGLFLEQGSAAAVRQQFLQILATQYGANPIGVEFTHPQVALSTINGWVARQTKNRIRALFDSIDPETVLVLANAVYLKAEWASQFDKGGTRDGPFSSPSGSVTAQLMSQTLVHVPYAAGEGWQRVGLPYAGGQLSMRVVVPTSPARELAALARVMEIALQPVQADSTATVELTLPKWDTASQLDLTSALPRAGLTDPFSSQADFSGIAPNLSIGQAVHRANITVDEYGTEAAAVTGIAMGMSADSRFEVLRADRPFAWAIVHEPTGTPLFTGHVVNPAGH